LTEAKSSRLPLGKGETVKHAGKEERLGLEEKTVLMTLSTHQGISNLPALRHLYLALTR